jgi:phosphoglycerol transferase MdoB-like AlkP superfamily enzyme
MKKRLLALAVYALFWLAFFFAARLFFILSKIPEASAFGFADLLATFSHGILLDASAIAYVMAVPMLVMLPGLWFSGDWYRRFLKIYTWLFIVAGTLIVVGDSILYRYWGFRMDYTPLLYLKTPKEAAASATPMQKVFFVLAVTAVSALFIWLYNRLVDRFFRNPGRVRFPIPSLLVFLLLSASLIIPIRGGVGLAPVNAGSVYFSRDMFLNHTAVNVVWNVGSSLFNQRPVENPYVFGDIDEAKSLVSSLTLGSGPSARILDAGRPNVLIIILESFGNYLVGSLGGDPLTTPRLNEYSEQGILFSSFYASGNRTDKALPAILSGYPAQPAASIIKEPRKTQTLPGIVSTLRQAGYSTSFWYGGDINFANFNSYLISAGFQDIVTMDDFDPATYNSKWGVHDHLLLEALRDSMTTAPDEPFLKVILTLSSHEPFEVPMETAFEGRDDLTKFRNSVHYADRSVGEFLDFATTTEWWDNTLVILLGDHCRRKSVSDLVYSEDIYKVPMLWLGGALDTAGMKVTATGSQVDLAPTLLSQLGLSGNFTFGKDLFSEQSGSFAYYAFNEGFAFITDSSRVVYDHKAGSSVLAEGASPGTAEKAGKAYLQVLFDDYLGR